MAVAEIPIADTYYEVSPRGVEQSIRKVQSQLKAARLTLDVSIDIDPSKVRARLALMRGLRVKVDAVFDRDRLRSQVESALADIDFTPTVNAVDHDGNDNNRRNVAPREPVRNPALDSDDYITRRTAEMREQARLMRVTRADAKLLTPLLGSGLRPQKGALGRAGGAISQVSVDADTSKARTTISRLKVEINNTVADINAGVDTKDANAKLFNFERRLRKLRFFAPDVRVRLEAREALAQMSEVTKRMRLEASRPIIFTVLARDNLDKVNRQIQKLKINSAMPQMGRLQKMILGVTAALGPLTIALGGAINVLGGLVVGVKQAAGALGVLPGLVATAAGAFAAFKVGNRGIGDALQAQAAQVKKAGKTIDSSATDIRNAQESVADALYAIDQQTSASAKSMIDLQRQRAAAFRDVAHSQLSVAQATKSYRDANLELDRTLMDLDRNQRKANLTLRSTKAALDEARAQGDPVALAEAEQAYQDAMIESQRTAEDNANTRKDAPLMRAGISSDYEDALQAQKDAIQNLADVEDQFAQTRESNARAAMMNQRALRDAQESVTTAQEASTAATDQFRVAMDKLSPSAQALVNKIIELRDAWHEVTTAVQEALYKGTADGLQRLSDTYIPLVKTGLVDIATSMNGVGSAVTTFLLAPEGKRLISDIMTNVADSIERLQPLMAPLLHSFLTLLEGSSAELPGLIDSFTQLVTKFDDFISKAVADGSFGDWVTTGVTALSDALDLTGQLLTLIGTLGESMNQMGGSPLQAMADGLRSFNESIADGTPGREALDSFFANIGTASREVFTPEFWDSVLAILSSFSDNLVIMAPHLSTFMQTFSDLLLKVSEGGSLTTILDAIFDAFSELFTVLAEPEFQDALTQIATSFADLLTEMVDSGLIDSFVSALAALAPVLIDAYVQAAEWFIPALQDLLDFVTAHPDLVASIVIGLQALQAVMPLIISIMGILIGLFSTGVGEAAAIAAGIAAISAAAVALWGAVSHIDWGKLWDTVWGGLKAGYEWLDNAANAPGQAVIDGFMWLWNWLTSFWDVHSPSRKMIYLAEMIVQGFMSGLSGIWTQLSGWADQLWGWASGLGSKVSSAASGMWNGIGDAFRTMIDSIKRWWNELDLSFTIPDNAFTRNTPILKDFAGDRVDLKPRLPMADGGEIFARPGGVSVQAAEAGRNELYQPLDKRHMAAGDHVIVDEIHQLGRDLKSNQGDRSAVLHLDASANFRQFEDMIAAVKTLLPTLMDANDSSKGNFALSSQIRRVLAAKN